MPTVITGTDGINQVQAGSIQSDDLAAGAITIGSGDLPSGAIINSKFKVDGTSVQTTSGSFVDTGYSISFTPSSSSSAIFVSFRINAQIRIKSSGSQDVKGYCMIAKDGTQIDNIFNERKVRLEASTNNNLIKDNSLVLSFVDTEFTGGSRQYSVFAKIQTNTTRDFTFQDLTAHVLEFDASVVE